MAHTARYFNPRSSCEERLFALCLAVLGVAISIHAPHARSDLTDEVNEVRALQISIHAPHARSDSTTIRHHSLSSNFNPRSSCEERLHYYPTPLPQFKFQSTLLMRGATQQPLDIGWRYKISIHAPHARSDYCMDVAKFIILISIHAPHARSDSVTFKH